MQVCGLFTSHAICSHAMLWNPVYLVTRLPFVAEVVVFDGIAYHQGSSGVKVLKGTERTPFMSVTLFDRQKCNQVNVLPGHLWSGSMCAYCTMSACLGNAVGHRYQCTILRNTSAQAHKMSNVHMI
jgi:hypothetical protein